MRHYLSRDEVDLHRSGHLLRVLIRRVWGDVYGAPWRGREYSWCGEGRVLFLCRQFLCFFRFVIVYFVLVLFVCQVMKGHRPRDQTFAWLQVRASLTVRELCSKLTSKGPRPHSLSGTIGFDGAFGGVQGVLLNGSFTNIHRVGTRSDTCPLVSRHGEALQDMFTDVARRVKRGLYRPVLFQVSRADSEQRVTGRVSAVLRAQLVSLLRIVRCLKRISYQVVRVRLPNFSLQGIRGVVSRLRRGLVVHLSSLSVFASLVQLFHRHGRIQRTSGHI